MDKPQATDTFVEYRGGPELHRPDDIMIAEDHRSTVAALVQAVIDLSNLKKLDKEGVVITAGSTTSMFDIENNKIPSTFLVSTGKGPKFIVNPDYHGLPIRMMGVRKDSLPNFNAIQMRVNEVYREITLKLDEIIDWDEVIAIIKEAGPISRFLFVSKDKLSAFRELCVNKRSSFMKPLTEMLNHYFKDKVGKKIWEYNYVQPKVKGDIVIFEATKL